MSHFKGDGWSRKWERKRTKLRKNLESSLLDNEVFNQAVTSCMVFFFFPPTSR